MYKEDDLSVPVVLLPVRGLCSLDNVSNVITLVPLPLQLRVLSISLFCTYN